MPKDFEEFLNRLEGVSNLVVYLEIDFPILFSYEKDNKLYLAYTIRQKYLKKQLTIFSAEIEGYSDILNMLDGEWSIFDVFDKEFNENANIFELTKDGLKIKDITLASAIEGILGLEEYYDADYIMEDILPEEDFYLTPILINKICLATTKEQINKINII